MILETFNLGISEASDATSECTKCHGQFDRLIWVAVGDDDNDDELCISCFVDEYDGVIVTK